MNLLALIIVLLVGGFLFRHLLTLLGFLPILGAMWGITRGDDSALQRRRGAVHAVAALGWLWNCYLLLGWCALAVAVTQYFAGRPSVVPRWLYYPAGFSTCMAPVVRMALAGIEPNRLKRKNAPDVFSALLAALAFIAFVLAPSALWPWAWFTSRIR